MPETGSQILSYSGSSGIGAGANAGIPVINSKNNLDVINNTARDILLLNHDNNLRLYNQKIQDRDNTLKLLAEGQVISKKISPEDRVHYDRAKKEANDAFFDMVSKGGINNTKAYKDYLEKVDEWKNITDWAQGRQIELDKLHQERADQTLPEDIEAYDNHIKTQQSKGFWQPIDPYQKAFNYDLNTSTNSILGQPISKSLLGGTGGQETGVTQTNTITDKNGVITKTQTTKKSPLKTRQTKMAGAGTFVQLDGTLSEISYTPEKYWDFNDIKKNVSEAYATSPTDRYTYQKFLSDVENILPPEQSLKLLEAYNDRIKDYSTQNGIAPDGTDVNGNLRYPDQVKYSQDPQTGKVLIQETPASFFAKHALASINGDYIEKPQPVLNEGVAKINILKQRANADEMYKRSMAGAANTKARAYADNLKQQMKYRKTAEDQDNFLNELWQRNLVQQPNLIETKGGAISFAPIKVENSLPVFTLQGKNPVQLIPIGATNTDLTGKNPHYEGGYFDTQYTLNNQVLSPQKLSELYINFVGQAQLNYKKGKGEEWKGDINDFIKEAVNDGNSGFGYQLKGANGTTDRQLSTAAQRIISNVSTKKGQTAVFDNNEQPPLDEQIPDDNQQ